MLVTFWFTLLLGETSSQQIWENLSLGTIYYSSIIFIQLAYCILTRTVKKRHQPVSIGKAALGGDWELIDHNGNKKSNTDYKGQWVLLYFGFSFCPDVCPEQMEKLVEAVDRIGRCGIFRGGSGEEPLVYRFPLNLSRKPNKSSKVTIPFP